MGGAELLNPPPLLFKHPSFVGSGTSLSQLNRAKCSVAALHEAAIYAPSAWCFARNSTSRPSSQASTRRIREPKALPQLREWFEGPAAAVAVWEPRERHREVHERVDEVSKDTSTRQPPRVPEWQANDRLSMVLSWGGLNRDCSHKDYFAWQR